MGLHNDQIKEIKNHHKIMEKKSKMVKFEYKLRAESLADLKTLIEYLEYFIENDVVYTFDEDTPIVELEFRSVLTLDKLITCISQIEDSHVMYQTVKPIDEYTGERNYELRF